MPPLVSAIQRPDGTWQQLDAQQNGFALFADADLAGTSLKVKGNYTYVAFNAGGLCSFASTNGDLYNSSCGSGGFFHIQTVWGVPPSAYAKIHAV